MIFVFGVVVPGMKGGGVMLGHNSIEDISKISKKERERWACLLHPAHCLFCGAPSCVVVVIAAVVVEVAVQVASVNVLHKC